MGSNMSNDAKNVIDTANTVGAMKGTYDNVKGGVTDAYNNLGNASNFEEPERFLRTQRIMRYVSVLSGVALVVMSVLTLINIFNLFDFKVLGLALLDLIF